MAEFKDGWKKSTEWCKEYCVVDGYCRWKHDILVFLDKYNAAIVKLEKDWKSMAESNAFTKLQKGSSLLMDAMSMSHEANGLLTGADISYALYLPKSQAEPEGCTGKSLSL